MTQPSREELLADELERASIIESDDDEPIELTSRLLTPAERDMVVVALRRNAPALPSEPVAWQPGRSIEGRARDLLEVELNKTPGEPTIAALRAIEAALHGEVVVIDALRAVWDDWITANDESGMDEYEIKDVSPETRSQVHKALTGRIYAPLPASSGEVRGAMAFIGKRLEDLAEANALYGKERHLSTPDKIARNNREISWLKDLRSILALKSSPSLAATLRQRAIDLRRNSSGGDDFDPKAAEFCAGILDSYANDIESGALR